MALYSIFEYPGDNVNPDFATPPYIDVSHLLVTVDDVGQTLGTHYTVSGTLLTFMTPPGAAAQVRIQRNSSPEGRLVDFNQGSAFSEASLDRDSLQAFYLAQEGLDTQFEYASGEGFPAIDGAALEAEVDVLQTEMDTVETLAASNASNRVTDDGRLTTLEAIDHLDNVVVVNSLSDFPTPAAGIISLASNTKYILGAAINTSDRFIMGAGTEITGLHFQSALTYIGSGTMFTCVNTDFRIANVKMNCPHASSTFISGYPATPNTYHAELVNVDLESCGTIGSLGNYKAIVIEHLEVEDCDQGLTITGTNKSLEIAFSELDTTVGGGWIGIDLGTSVNTVVEIFDVDFYSTLAGGIGISGTSGGTNMASGYIGHIRDCTFETVSPLGGLDTSDEEWCFVGNGGAIQDTYPDALIYMRNNATATTITASSVDGTNAVPVAGTWSEEVADHFTSTAAGRITYTGIEDLPSPIDVQVNLQPASGANKVLMLYIAINGVVEVNSGIKVKGDNGHPLHLSCSWQPILTTNDYVEVFVENQTDDIDIEVENAIFRVR